MRQGGGNWAGTWPETSQYGRADSWPGSPQDRQFTYDSLSRLLTASNPESGTTFYSYDSNGNMLTRTRPAPNQADPGKTVTTNYSYDALNRVARKSYSDSVTPEVDFVYDQGSINQYSPSFTNGRLAYALSPNSTMDIYSYDKMGRVTDAWQCVTAPCTAAWHAQQTFDLGGDLLSLAYNGGAALSYQYDSSQRITKVGSAGLSTLPGTLFNNASYGPVGLLGATLGNGLTETRAYNSRTWLASLSLSNSVYSLTNLTYAGNGDVLSANDSANTNWTYQYDDFNRLYQATNTSTNPNQIYQYRYDRFDNRWQQNYVQGQGTNYQIQLTFNANNQINGMSGVNVSPYQYDAAGNLQMDAQNCYSYDAENRLSSEVPKVFVPSTGLWVCGSPSATSARSYLYDPEGRRVAKLQNGSISEQYYYDAGGDMITDADANGNTIRAEIYAGSRHLATWTNNATYFNHADWLGTERVRSNSSGATCETITSLPFGDGEVTGGSCTPTPTFFTGLERDAESGLDHTLNRQYPSNLGRWLTPDPLGGHIEDPQTLNKYAYVRNNPTSLTDPTGLDFYLSCNVADHSGCTQVTIDKTKVWVQAGSDGNARVVTSDSIREGENKASMNGNGVQINGKNEGIYFDNPASHTTDASGKDVNHNPVDLAGAGDLGGFSFHVDRSDPKNGVLSGGTFSFNGTDAEMKKVLSESGFNYGFGYENAFGNPHHPGMLNYRFSENAGRAKLGFNEGPSLHITIAKDPKLSVPREFHVDSMTGFAHRACADGKGPCL